MNRKMLIISILAFFMLVAISFASAVSTNTTNTGKKESPLWQIKKSMTIGEKIGNIIQNIKTKFLGERIFFLPSRLIKPRKVLEFDISFAGTQTLGDFDCCPKTTWNTCAGVECVIKTEAYHGCPKFE